MRVFALVAIALASCSIDASIERARARVLALDARDAARIVAFCRSWHRDGYLEVRSFPSVLPAQPTTIVARSGTMTFQWWNNSHFEEDRPNPGFELICSDRAVAGAKAVAPGLWYRDAPSNM